MGVSTGQACWTVAVSLGVAAVLTSSEAAFSALKIVRAGYLAFLGIQALVSAVRGREAPRTRVTFDHDDWEPDVYEERVGNVLVHYGGTDEQTLESVRRAVVALRPARGRGYFAL
jgi:hypothetical protein